MASALHGQHVQGFAGVFVAAALHASGIRILRESPRAGAPRGAFCWMGLCQECTVIVEGVRRPACRTQISEGLTVLAGRTFDPAARRLGHRRRACRGRGCLSRGPARTSGHPRGRGSASGVARYTCPPACGASSTRVTASPCRAAAKAAPTPAGPPPMTKTSGGGVKGSFPEAPSGPH